MLTGLNHLSMPDAAAGPPLVQPAMINPTPVAVATELALDSTAANLALLPKTTQGASAYQNVPLAQLVRTDPWAVARLGQERYEREIQDYTCVFLKQERIDGKLRKVEKIEVRFRDAPKSVFMVWLKNADQAKRVLYQDTAEFVNKQGEKVARVEPAGALIRLVVSDILMPIHGKRAQKSSRRSIDDFGFHTTFSLLNRYNQLGLDQGALDLRYEGESEIDGRPTYKIVRYLPYTGPGGPWPDAKMVMHLDQEVVTTDRGVFLRRCGGDQTARQLRPYQSQTQSRLRPGCVRVLARDVGGGSGRAIVEIPAFPRRTCPAIVRVACRLGDLRAKTVRSYHLAAGSFPHPHRSADSDRDLPAFSADALTVPSDLYARADSDRGGILHLRAGSIGVLGTGFVRPVAQPLRSPGASRAGIHTGDARARAALLHLTATSGKMVVLPGVVRLSRF